MNHNQPTSDAFRAASQAVLNALAPLTATPHGRAALQAHARTPGFFPLIRAALASTLGLMDTDDARARLVQGPAAQSGRLTLPALPEMHADQRDMWLRVLAARLTAAAPWPTWTAPGTWTSSVNPDPVQRAPAAVAAVRGNRAGRVVYAAANWAERETVSAAALDEQVHVTTLELAVGMLGASRPGNLDRLSALLDGAGLVLDGLHRFDPRALSPLSSLLHDLRAYGVNVHVTGSVPSPLMDPAVSAPAGRVPGAFWFHPHVNAGHELAAEARAARDRAGRVTVLVPSRRAALGLLAHFEAHEARLSTRTKTAAHLRREARDSDAPITISTWGAYREAKDAIVSTRAPLPVLADAALSTADLTVCGVTEWRPPNSAVTQVDVTVGLLAQGLHPADPVAMQTYWSELLAVTNTDALDIGGERRKGNYATVSARLAALFGSGQVVVVQDGSDGAEQLIVALRDGTVAAPPPHHPSTARITAQSAAHAEAQGWVERTAGDALIWTGPYAEREGVGLP